MKCSFDPTCQRAMLDFVIESGLDQPDPTCHDLRSALREWPGYRADPPDPHAEPSTACQFEGSIGGHGVFSTVNAAAGSSSRGAIVLKIGA